MHVETLAWIPMLKGRGAITLSDFPSPLRGRGIKGEGALVLIAFVLFSAFRFEDVYKSPSTSSG
jgi:hypothetical protein